MKRKETLSRLLLTLLTAFVMVAGAFVAAVPTDTGQDESPSMPVAVRELDEGTGEAGEAPASAAFSEMNTETQQDMVSPTDNIGEMDIPIAVPAEASDEEYNIEKQEDDGLISQDLSLAGSTSESGTRAATVDAGGPYGTRDNPLYEGNPVNFVANIAGDINDNYLFRWDVNDDDEFDGPGSAPDYWGAYGDNDLNVQYNDNHIGEAKVEAWDGVSETTVSGGGNVFDNTRYQGYWYWYGSYVTWGYQFTTSEDITIDEVGWFRAYYPYQVYYIDFWDTSGAWIDGSGYITGSQSTYRWNWRTLSSPITLAEGEYVVTTYARTYGGRTPWIRDPTPTSDGVIDINTVRYYQGYRFPQYSMSTSYIPAIDFEYEYSYQIPDLLEDTADCFIDNVAPIVINPMATVSLGQEGSEVEFTGWFMDPGLDDDWQYRWDWGDGTTSDWKSINKFAGGAQILICTTWRGIESQVRTSLQGQLGPFATQIDIYNWYTEGSPPDLDYMLEYDVVIVGTNYIPSGSLASDMGDRLAEYVEAGGNVVQMWSSFHTSDRITGRWVSDEYQAITRGSLSYGYEAMGTVYDPSHPIMNGVTSLTAYYKHNTYSVTTYATRLADYATGKVLCAYDDQNHPGAPSSRIVGLSMWPNSGYCSGDWLEMFGNAVRWASQEPDPTLLPMPIQVPLTSHIYEDDHPTTTTPEDIMAATLQVRDDDHGRVFGGAEPQWEVNIAQAPAATASNSGGGVGVWGPQRLNNGDKIGTYNDCWNRGNGGSNNWVMLVWPTAQFIGGMTAYYTRYRSIFGYTLHACEVEYWDGSSWVFDHHYDDLDHGNSQRDAFIQLVTGPVTTTRVRLRDMKTFGANSNIMIQEWEVHPGGTGGDPYEMDGLGEGSCEVTIENVFPGAMVPDFNDVVDERVTIDFEGFKLTDPALYAETEEFWYRWDYGDGTPIGPWIYKGNMATPELDVLLLHTYSFAQDPIVDGLSAIMGDTVTIDEHDCGPYGTVPTLSYLMQYDVIAIGSNYIPRTAVGNVLDDYADAGGGVVELVAMFHPRFGISGQWRSKGYSVFQQSSALMGYSSVDILDPTHPIIDGAFGTVSSFGCSLAIGTSGVTSGAVRLAESGATPTAAYRNEDDIAPGSGRVAGLNIFAMRGYYSGDAYLAIANAIWWASQVFHPTPTLDTVSHDYGDNGIYTAGLQIIDDDMTWDWAPGDAQPTFTGPGDPNDWISFVYFPVEVLNVDPVISPRMRAEVNLDLVIRTTGEPKNDCTMTLWQGTTALGSVTVHHDGNYKMETLPATLDMGSINDYYVTVEYTNADPDGANPTWVFAGKFPSGHTKELKNVFKEDGTLWTIDSSLLKTMLIGEDIVFTAVGADDGSDDLAFNWQFGDGVYDLNVYANLDSSMVEGTSQQPEDIFNAHPDRDPWFDMAPNTIRSPDMNPIVIVDETSHAFSEGGYYFVTLILMDDDVCDGYPSFQVFLNGGGYDIEFMEIDLS